MASPDEALAPPGVDRRAFVKGALAGAAVSVAGATGFVALRSCAQIDPYTLVPVRYIGATVRDGSPAPRGIPLIPLHVDDDGYVAGRPTVDGTNVLNWYRYCGHEGDPGLTPSSTADNVFRYDLPADKVENAGARASEYYWYLDRLGDRVRADDFSALAFGSGAAVRWRSEGVPAISIVTAIILKLDPSTLRGPAFDDARPLIDVERGLLAYSTFCTHLCCVPGYKESETARRRGWWEDLHCACHNSRFDPTRLSTYTFDLRLPRGEKL